MRSYSPFSILLLCLVIFIVDVLAFYWLQSITQLLSSIVIKRLINILFWVFTSGLILSIIVLKATLDSINPRRKQLFITSLYGLVIASLFPKLLFVIIISVLYFTNYMFSENESIWVIPLVGLLSGFLPFFIIVYSIFIALYRFKIKHVKIKLENVSNAFNPIKIIHISDLHLGGFNFRYHIMERAVKKINNLNGDYIFFTGDLVNNYAWELRGWDSVFKKLKAKKGKYAVLGNHDYGDYSKWESPDAKAVNFKAIKQFYNDIDFQLLLNQSVEISEPGLKAALIGVENWGKPPFKKYGDLKQAMDKVETIPFKILLSHDPTHWSEEVVGKTDITLTLSGHTHGMQAGFKYKNFKWSPIKYKFKHWAGLYKENNQYLYVNTGLGWLGFPGRLGMRPEITCIEFIS